jgi:hypothetical protein
MKAPDWCAVAAYVLIAIVEKELQFAASHCTCLQILSISVFERAKLSRALQTNVSATNRSDSANQLTLFES